MNLIQQSEELKSLPDQQLVQMQQNPSYVPPYLVVAEMQRRASMRKAFQGAQAMAQPQQPPVAQQLTQQSPVRMADGGMVDAPADEEFSLASLFSGMAGPPQVDVSMIGMSDLPNYSTMNDQGFNEMRKLKLNPQQPRDWVAHQKIMKEQMGKSPLEEIAAKYGKDEESYRNKKMGLGEILMHLGLGMAASKRPDFLGALGEGGVGALHGWSSDRDRNVALANQAAAKRMQALEGLQRHNDRIQDYSIDAARGEQARYNQERQNDMSIEAQIQRQARDEKNQRSMLERQIEAARATEERQSAKGDMDYEKAMALQVLKNTGDLDVARLRAMGQGKKGKSSKDPAEAGIRNFNSLADDFMRNAENLEKQAEAIISRSDPNHPDSLRKSQLLAKANQARQQADQFRFIASQALLKSMGIELPPAPQQEKEISLEEARSMFSNSKKPTAQPPAQQQQQQPTGPGIMQSLADFFTKPRQLPHYGQ